MTPPLRSIALLLALAAPAAAAAAQDTTAVQVAAATPAAAPADTIVPLDRIVAIVGSTPILMSDALTELAYRRSQGMPAPADSAEFATVLRQIVVELVDVELLVVEAGRLAVEVTDADVKTVVDQRVEEIRKGFPSEAELREALRASGQGTLEEWRRALTEQARKRELQNRLVQQLKAESKLPPVPVTDSMVAEAFDQMSENRPRRPAMVGFRQIIIAPRASVAAKAAAKVQADSVRAEIAAGGDFEAIARRESMDGSAQLGGDLGWLRRGATVPEFERWLFALPVGQLSPVVETPFGFHVIRVDRAQPAEVKARHILIMPQVDSADLARARAEADSVAQAWRAGAPYDTLRVRHHDRPEQSLVPEYELEQLPQSYQDAFRGVQEEAVTAPFEIDDPRSEFPKLVVAQVISLVEGGEYTLEDVKARFRQQLSEERAFRRYLDDLREQIFVDVRP